MKKEQAIRMIQLRLPKMNERDAGSLASSLHNYPLAIHHACTLLEIGGTISVDELSRDFRADIEELAGGIPLRDGATLLSILRYTLTLIEQRDPVAADLLTYICFTSRHVPGVPEVFLKYCLAVDAKSRISTTRYMQAVGVLHRFQLVDIDQSGRIRSGSNARLTIHGLTKSLLYAILKDRFLEIARRFVIALMARHADIFKKHGHKGIPRDIAIDVGLSLECTCEHLCKVFITMAEENATKLEELDPALRLIAEELISLVLENPETPFLLDNSLPIADWLSWQSRKASAKGS